MKILIKIIIGVWIFGFLNGGVFALPWGDFPFSSTTYYNSKEADIIRQIDLEKRTDSEWNVWSTQEEASESNSDIKENNEMFAEIKKEEDIEKAKEAYKNWTASDDQKKLLSENWASQECKDPKKVQTSVKIDSSQQAFCFFTKDWNAWCKSWVCSSSDNWSTLRVFNDSVWSQTWLTLIQTYLSKILWFVIKFWAMLAVLAIVIWWIQISMSMEDESKWPWKEKIMWWIAALLVLFFAWVILNFINPAYYVW